MSKKHHSKHQNGSGSVGTTEHAAEYKIIRHDLIKVVYLNLIYLAAVLAVYFSNSKTHYLEKWFANVFKF